ncbi:MAG TPA: hypothetical protein VMX57_08045 [Planctomycetota bacterium]|nr:hypothetical protein [Planctomycetota bacterium]
MSRRMTRTKTGAVSLDSFLDIVTNTLGLLILIATLTVISSRDIKIDLGRGVMRPPDEKLERVIFECRGNRVIPVEESPPGDDPTGRVQTKEDAEEYNRRNVTNGFHRYEVEPTLAIYQGRVVMATTTTLQPLDHPVGDRISDLKREDSEFVKRASRLNPKKHWVYFVVREDSFEAFRMARSMLTARKFDVGWQPRPSSLPISFSGVGTPVGPG